STRLALGRARRRRSRAPSRSTRASTGETVLMLADLLLLLRLDLVVHRVQPALAGGELLPQQHEVGFAIVLRAIVESGEAGASLGHHVQRQPGTRAFLVLVPGCQLGLAQFF